VLSHNAVVLCRYARAAYAMEFGGVAYVGGYFGIFVNRWKRVAGEARLKVGRLVEGLEIARVAGWMGLARGWNSAE